MRSSLTRRHFTTLTAAAVCGISGTAVSAQGMRSRMPVQESARISLLPPRMEGGMPLFEALKNRKTTRAFSTRMPDLQTLSDLLWCADGINRDDGRRTAPSALNSQTIALYVILPNGVYLYDPAENALDRVLEGNFQKLAGTQDYAQKVPVTLVYVSDLNRSNCSPETREPYARVDCGFIGQNVYLFAASEGLATVFRGSLDFAGLAKMLKLKEGQIVLYAQSVGYPEEDEKRMASPIRLVK